MYVFFKCLVSVQSPLSTIKLNPFSNIVCLAASFNRSKPNIQFCKQISKAVKMDGDYDPSAGPQENGAEKKSKGGKRLSVERIYQKKSQLEHILLRPDTYIGSVQPVTEKMWVLEEVSHHME